jgi:hypothetical protein
VAKAQLFARGPIDKAAVLRRDNALRHQFSKAGKDRSGDRHWTKVASGHRENPFAVPDHGDCLPLYDVSGWVRPAGPRPSGPPNLVQLVTGVVNWPTGRDAGPVTRALLWAKTQGPVFLRTKTSEDIPDIIAEQGFEPPRQARETARWDVEGRFRLNIGVARP